MASTSDRSALMDFNSIKTHRVVQLMWIAQITLALFLVLQLLIGKDWLLNVTLAVGLIVTFGCLLLVKFQRAELAIPLFLINLTGVNTAAVWLYNGLSDTAILGYPGILIFAAMLGTGRLYYLIFTLMMVSVAGLGYVNIYGILAHEPPEINWLQTLDIGIILFVVGFAIRLILQDFGRLTQRLLLENEKVLASQDEITHLAHHDNLTGLPNRILTQDRFEQAMAQAKRNDTLVAVLFVDLDHFKPVNDMLGHDIGDALLKEVAKRIREHIRQTDTICRFGGDEFLIILESCYSQLIISDISNKILNQLNQPFQISSHTIEISGSIGIALAPTDGTDFAEVCKKADLAMYQAKEFGRNNCSFYDDALNQQVVDKYNMINDLRMAITKNKIEVYYQPKIELTDNHIIGAEALLRWPQADGSFISPELFVPIAEENGMINELGKRVLQQACVQCRRWHDKGFPELTVAVNLSVLQFNDGNLETVVMMALEQSKLSPKFLELEITESMLIDKRHHVADQIVSLKEKGVSFSIDDFGTGYSNLGYLNKYQLQLLKIDRSFIAKMNELHQDRTIVKAIIQMAKGLGIKTVAEGVESPEMLELLKYLGCDYGQGFFWSKALDAEQFLEFLDSGVWTKKPTFQQTMTSQ